MMADLSNDFDHEILGSTMKIRFALAVNKQNKFERKHFGVADKFVVYEWFGDDFSLISELPNTFKSNEEPHVHGSKKKGNDIINYLQQAGVRVLVSVQFGKNIQVVNKHFALVKTSSKTARDVLGLLAKYMKWIEDELLSEPENYKLFDIRNGVVKSSVKKANYLSPTNFSD